MKLFTQTTIGKTIVNNHFIMAPMCTNLAKTDGFVNDEHFVHYGATVDGGIGLVIVEATAVLPNGRITDKDLGIWSDEHVAGLKRLVDYAHHKGCKIGIQLSHAGRKSAVPNNKLVGPTDASYDNTYQENFGAPHPLTEDEIAEIITAFGTATTRAKEAGFDIIELHAAHGYLINQFLSPLSNTRLDAYGGKTNAERARFLQEILAEVQKNWDANLGLFARFSAEEYHPDGLHPEDIAEVINLLAPHLDAAHISTGGNVPLAPTVYPGYQLKPALTIQSLTSIPVIAVGLLDSKEMIHYAYAQGIEFFALGRSLLFNPNHVWALAEDFGIREGFPPLYQRALPSRR